MRRDKEGQKSQRTEIRFDDIGDRLRTGSGGSSRQFIMIIEGETIRSRLLSAREAARLMGVPENYQLPKKYSEGYHLLGDGLVAPVVSWLERHVLYPLAAGAGSPRLEEPEAYGMPVRREPIQLTIELP